MNLEPDCKNCAALCCLALAFDKGEMFAFDKPAGTPCAHLDESLRCKIHADLAKRGCAGCVHYSCDGAGQRVVSEVFNGQSWQQIPALKAPMMEAFQHMRQVHKYLVLLQTAKGLPLSMEQERERLRLFDRLSPAVPWSLDGLRAFARGGFDSEIEAFFAGLKSAAQAAQQNRTGNNGNGI